MSTLEIKDLHVHVETKEGIKPILKGATLTVHSGETHAIMGPNGSGKSTLAYTLAGHPKYVVDSGEALLDGKDILKMTPDERAKAGICCIKAFGSVSAKARVSVTFFFVASYSSRYL